MKLKYFYRIDNQGRPVLASNIRRKSKPFAGRWQQLFNKCCDPADDIECNCGFRYFVQIDHANNPVDHTLIKRLSKPNPDEGIKFMEVTWVDPCCVED